MPLRLELTSREAEISHYGDVLAAKSRVQDVDLKIIDIRFGLMLIEDKLFTFIMFDLQKNLSTV